MISDSVENSLVTPDALVKTKALEYLALYVRQLFSKFDVHAKDVELFSGNWHVPFLGRIRDKKIGVFGISTASPPIRSSLGGGQKVSFEGVEIYRASTDPDVVYALISMRLGDYGSHVPLTVVPKGLVFRWRRHVSRLSKLENSNEQPPVLEDGYLDKIVQSTVGFLLHAKKMEQYQARLKKGLLMGGPPGNGKTMACRWLQKLCSENGIAYATITSSELEKAFGDNKMLSVVSQSPVIFFDDIDISFLSRGVGGDSRMACALAAALDGFGPQKHTVRIFTSNEDVSTVDPAFKRPGRIDQWININLPTQRLRVKLIERWHPDIVAAISVTDIAEKTEGYSFADLEAIKSFAVLNFVSGKGWDFDRAIKEFQEFKPDKIKGKVGFEAEVESYKSRMYKTDTANYPTPAVAQ